MAGQIIKRGENSWTVRIFLGRDATGRRKYVNKTIRGTKKDAQIYLNAKLREKDLGGVIETTKLTLGEYFDKWLMNAARPRVTPRTADGYSSLFNRYLRKSIGNLQIESLQPIDVQTIYSKMLDRKLSARIVRHTHSVLRNALKQAVRWNLVQKNVADFVDLPKVPHSERIVLTPETAHIFLNTGCSMLNGLIFEFALLSGMRPEEFLALQWKEGY